MRKVIVTTTIHPPTEALRRFAAMDDWELVVVGDKKTPERYSLERAHYLSPADQERMDKELSDAIGWNCIQRRNFGLLKAWELGAEVIAVVDDDNIPKPGWGENLLLGREVEVDFYETDLPAFDPVGATNYPNLWHRGFPLQLVSARHYERSQRKTIVPEVQADFWDGDPDVDAFCRMEHAPHCRFDERKFPLASNRIGPFNSQNTFLLARCLPDYFLFPHVGRMDDIWASFHLQARGAVVVYNKATVVQERNPHDPVRDLKAEYLGYEWNLDLVKGLAEDRDYLLRQLPESSRRAYELYRKHF